MSPVDDAPREGAPLGDLIVANLALLLLLGTILAAGLAMVDVVETEYEVVATIIEPEGDTLDITLVVEERHGDGTPPNGTQYVSVWIDYHDSLGERGRELILERELPLDRLWTSFDGVNHTYQASIPYGGSEEAQWADQTIEYYVHHDIVWEGGRTVGERSYITNNVPEVLRGENHAPDASLSLSLEDYVLDYYVNATDPDGDGLRYLVDFGDGETSEDRGVLHVYDHHGIFIVNVTVTDGKVNGTVHLREEVTVVPNESFTVLDSERGAEGLELVVEMTNVGQRGVRALTGAFALLDSEGRVHEFADVEGNDTLLLSGESVTLTIAFDIGDEVVPVALLYDYRLETPLH